MTTELKAFDRCTFTIGADNKLVVEWDNGVALQGIKGASVDYIGAEMRFVLVKTGEGKYTYDMNSQLKYFIDAKIEAKMAFCLAMMRQCIMSMESIQINLTEAHVINVPEAPFALDNKISEMINKKDSALKTLIQQSFTLLAFNGISMVNTGHHYSVADAMWTKFNASTGFSDACTELGLLDWENRMFHDLYHPVDIDWLAGEVCSKKSALLMHVNGCASTRIPAIPAGTVILSVLVAMHEYIATINSEAAKLFDPAANAAKYFLERIKEKPLDWCVNFKRTDTMVNLEKVNQFKHTVCVMYGYIAQTASTGKKPSVLRSKAATNLAKNEDAFRTLGEKLAEVYTAEKATPDVLIANIKAVVGEIKTVPDHGVP